MTFYVTQNDGSVLLSCTKTPVLGLIQPHTRLDNLPPRACLITNSVDDPKNTKRVSVHSSRKEVSTQSSKQESTVATQCQGVTKLVTSKDHIMQRYPGVFEGIGCFPGPSYHIQLEPNITPKHTPYRPILECLKEAFKQEIDKMLKAGVLKPVQEATPSINSFALVEGKDKLGSLKLRIYLDPANLNKAIVREPYHFKTPENIAHLLADVCMMSVFDLKKGYWHQQLDDASSCLLLLTHSLEDLDTQ